MRKPVTQRAVVVTILALFAMMAFGACAEDGDDALRDQREDAMTARTDSFKRGEALHPPPTGLVNFIQRAALVEFTKRQDLIQPWYIYIFSPLSGEPTGYYVGSTYPISTCNFLSSTEGENGLTAPSYDAMYYGGGGASAACQGVFFFDLETDRMVTLNDLPWAASDGIMNWHGDVPQISARSDGE